MSWETDMQKIAWFSWKKQKYFSIFNMDFVHYSPVTFLLTTDHALLSIIDKIQKAGDKRYFSVEYF